jgi:hypothetical protein
MLILDILAFWIPGHLRSYYWITERLDDPIHGLANKDGEFLLYDMSVYRGV